MTNSKFWMPSRRTVLKAGLAAGALPFASPYISTALGEDTVKIGFVDPLTGVYAAAQHCLENDDPVSWLARDAAAAAP